MSDMNIEVKISADATAVGTAVQKGSSDLSAFTAVAKEMTSALQAGFAQIASLSEKMNATMQAGFAQTGFVLRSMASGMGEVSRSATTELPRVVPEVEKIEKAAKKAEVNFGMLGQKLASVGMALSLSITAPITAATYSIFEATKTMDSLKLSLTAVAGSAEGMKKQLADMKEVAKLPGLGMQEAVTGTIRLQAAGISAEQAKKSLMAFGNALATVGKGKAELDGVTLALSQIQSKGKVFAEEINQLNERLPQIRGAMKDAFGTANAEDLQKLGISSEEFIAKVTASFAKLPKMTGGLQNDMENMSDQWKTALTEMGEGLKPFFSMALQVFTAVSGKLAELGKWFSSLSDSQRAWIVSAVAVAAAIGPVLLGVGKAITIMIELKEAFAIARVAMIAMNLTMLANPFVAAAAAILAVTMAVIGLKSAMDDLSSGDIEQKAARSPEALAANKKVEAYQHAYDQLSEGKDRDEVGRKLGLAKGERDAAFAKDDEFLKKGTTLEPGNVQGSGTFDVKGVLAQRGIYERNTPAKKGKQTGVSEGRRAEIAEQEKDFKDSQKLEASQEKLRIESITNETEREREIRSAKYREDIEKAQGNKALLLAVNAKYAADLRQIDSKEHDKRRAEEQKRDKALVALEEMRWNESIAAMKDGEAKESAIAERNNQKNLANLKREYGETKVYDKMVLAEMSRFYNEQVAIRKEADKKMTESNRKANESILQSSTQMFTTLAGVMEQTHGKQSASYKAMFALSKAFTIAKGLMDMQFNISEASKAGWPQNIPLMAVAAAQGAIVIADMQSIQASFAVGTPSVPRDMVAQIHKGETIVPSTFAEGIRKGEMTLGGPGAGKGGRSEYGATVVIGPDIIKAVENEGKALFKIIKNSNRKSFLLGGLFA